MTPTGKLYAILSDVHGNLSAFRTVLDYVRGLAVERICCLGDLVGYGAAAGECIELAHRYDVVCVQGNHDAQVRPPRDPQMRPEAVAALDYAFDRLPPEEVDWLANLPRHVTPDPGIVLVHGALTGRDDYILRQEDVDRNFTLLAEHFPNADTCFFGHTHLAMVIGPRGARTRFPDSTVAPLQPATPYLINPGSVGQPRDGVPRASFALYDTADRQLTLVRLDYDVEAEQARIREAGLPEKLWKRLALGR